MQPFRVPFSLLILLLLTINAQAQQSPTRPITVSFDFQSAKAVCNLLAGKKIDTTVLHQVAKLYGNTLLIKKVKGYSGKGEDVFKSTLKEIITTGTIKGDDPYNWKEVQSNLKGINKLLNYLSNNQQQFTAEVQQLIGTYTPKELETETKASFIVGGGALGFTIGDDATFSVALQKIGDDLQGLKYLVAHELYHNIQSAAQNKRIKINGEKPPYHIKATYYLLYNLWAEGTANYVGDFDKIKYPAAFSREQQQQSKKNAERKVSNFYLLESLIYRQYTDTTAKYQPLYDIAYSTAFDESSYYVGQEIAAKIDHYKGATAIADLTATDPLLFIWTYIQLYRSMPNDKSFTRFSLSVEQLIEKLLDWKDRI